MDGWRLMGDWIRWKASPDQIRFPVAVPATSSGIFFRGRVGERATGGWIWWWLGSQVACSSVRFSGKLMSLGRIITMLVGG